LHELHLTAEGKPTPPQRRLERAGEVIGKDQQKALSWELAPRRLFARRCAIGAFLLRGNHSSSRFTTASPKALTPPI
jgi:hypothetical protein